MSLRLGTRAWLRAPLALERFKPRLQARKALALNLEFFARDEFKLLEGLGEQRLQVSLEVGCRTRPEQFGETNLGVGE
jgi:hypothetical protein